MPREKFDDNQSTLGIELIKILTEQLSGSVKLLPKEGTYYQILFKEIKK
jgi:two-component sensor histidine kinase